jgi:hypothetical protein
VINLKYTQIPENTFEKLQLNAGVICSKFDTSTGEITDIVGATTGGNRFSATPSFTDFGEDIDNCPKNTAELKMLDSWEIKMTGTFVTVTGANVATLAAAADSKTTDGDTTLHAITLRDELKASDFKELWWVGDYSAVNEDGDSGDKAGFIAIKMSNTLSTGGFAIQSTDKSKGQFAFEFTAHYSIKAQHTVPCEIYVRESASKEES